MFQDSLQNRVAQPKPVLETAPVSPLDGIAKIVKNGVSQYWESESTRPVFEGSATSAEAVVGLDHAVDESLSKVMASPFLSLKEIRAAQFSRIQELVAQAYADVPVYQRKYREAGFKPEDLKTWDDFERIPVITKDEMIAAGLEACVSPRWPIDDYFCTRSFGTSGKTLPIRVNLDAILIDTLQGVRQFWMQSGMKYQPEHLAAMIYTVPWWFEKIAGGYPSSFISGLIPPEKMVHILNEMQPEIVSCYPTNLKALLPFLNIWDRKNLYYCCVHSEGSTRAERDEWSKMLGGVPVLDEYSSEEATRIALEMPCGHYHVCEDAVYLEVLNPETQKVQPDGQSGLTVITNLLNEGMLFIRYVQGDYISRPAQPSKCANNWSQIATLDGRVNDSFINQFGRVVPAGTILDTNYRWMYDSGLNINQFELVQKSPEVVHATLLVTDKLAHPKVRRSIKHLEKLLELVMGHSVKVEATLPETFPERLGKRRLIRRDFVASNVANLPVIDK